MIIVIFSSEKYENFRKLQKIFKNQFPIDQTIIHTEFEEKTRSETNLSRAKPAVSFHQNLSQILGFYVELR